MPQPARGDEAIRRCTQRRRRRLTFLRLPVYFFRAAGMLMALCVGHVEVLIYVARVYVITLVDAQAGAGARATISASLLRMSGIMVGSYKMVSRGFQTKTNGLYRHNRTHLN